MHKLTNRYFVDYGRKNYLGQSMLQRVCHCQAVPRVVVHESRPG